jgi:hypothetical protein
MPSAPFPLRFSLNVWRDIVILDLVTVRDVPIGLIAVLAAVVCVRFPVSCSRQYRGRRPEASRRRWDLHKHCACHGPWDGSPVVSLLPHRRVFTSGISKAEYGRIYVHKSVICYTSTRFGIKKASNLLDYDLHPRQCIMPSPVTALVSALDWVW